ncbi:uncharacterized protein METZ01_LOCUS443685, partial [marine metagenome]
QSELVDIFNKGKKGNPDPNLVGIKIGKAYMNYVSAGINAGGGAFTGMTGASQLGTDLGDLLAKSPNMGPSHAATFSMRVNTCLSTFLSVHQTTIITAAGTSALFSELNDIYSKPKGHASLYAMALGRALNNFTLAAVVIGVIPDTPGIPFTGPIS